MTVLGFSMPHFWFPWSLEKLGWEQAGLIGDLKSLFFPLDIAISVLGPIIGIGVFLIPIAGIIKFIKTREWNETPVHFLTICTIAAILILTFTDSSYEWHAHGFLFMTVCVSIIAGWFIAKLSCGKYRHVVIGIFTLMLIIQVPYFVINYIQRQSDPAPPDAIAMQENVPFGTVVYKYRDPREVYMEDSEFYNNLRRGMGYAGRLVIFPTMAHLPYMNHPRVLNKLADPIFFRPCNKTRYGMNIPDGNYLEIIDGKMVERSCRDPKVAKRTYMRVAPR